MNTHAYQFRLFPHSFVAESASVYTDAQAPAISPDLIEASAAAWWEKFTPAQRERINGRFERGKNLALAGDVAFTEDPQTFNVRSQSTKGSYHYLVCLEPSNRSCSCPDFPDAPYHACKHIIAAYIIQKALEISEAQAPAEQPAEEQPAAESEETVSLNYQLRRPKDNIIYGTLTHEDKQLPVEILWAENGRAIVRALPKVEKKTLVPVYPFPSPFGGDNSPCWSTAEVDYAALSNVKIFVG